MTLSLTARADARQREARSDQDSARGSAGARALLTLTITLALLAWQALAGPPSAIAQGTLMVSALVGPAGIGAPVSPGFLGISSEFSALTSYAGSDPSAIDPLYVALLRALAPQPVLRIGGDSTDVTWWPVPGMPAPGGVNFSLTPSWMRVLRATAAQLGARLILGVNLAAGSAELASAEARAYLANLDSQSIEALEIGNEPDLYPAVAWYKPASAPPVFSRAPGYDPQQFLGEFAQWRAALPQAPVAGPAFESTAWLPYLLQFMAEQSPLAIVTFHQYPLSACQTNPAAASYPSIPNLLADRSSAGLAAQVTPYAWLAHALGEQFRVDELNSVSCRGKAGVSDTFAAALWALDTLFHLAAAGVDGVNVHFVPGAANQAFSVSMSNGHWTAVVHPLYYGLLAFTDAFPAGARLVPVTAPAGAVKVWATVSAGGVLHVTVINESPSTPAIVRLRVSGTRRRAPPRRSPASRCRRRRSARRAGDARRAVVQHADEHRLPARQPAAGAHPPGARRVLRRAGPGGLSAHPPPIAGGALCPGAPPFSAAAAGASHAWARELTRFLDPGSVHLAVEVPGELARDARHGFELLGGGGEDRVRGAEVREQRPLARRADARQLVEDRGGHRVIAPLAVVGDREPVRFVAQPLQQLQLGRVVRERERRRAARDEHLLDPLGERDDEHAALAEALQRPQPGGELTLAAVDDDDVREGREARVVVLVVR